MGEGPFYVYELIDPRDKRPFYIGKGVRNRVHQHAKDAERGVSGPKCDRIRAIVAAGFRVKHRIIERFADERAAYEFEAQLIASIGLGSLTNIAPGGTGGSYGPPIAEDIHLAKELSKIAKRTADFTWFPAFVRLGDALYPMGACHVLSLALIHAKLVSRRGAEWVARKGGASLANSFASSGA